MQRNISKAYSDKTLFSGLSLVMAPGDRIALIGSNGSGKTTLLEILAGDSSPDSGSISKKRNVSLGYLRQEIAPFAGKPLLQEVLDASSEATALEDRVVAAQKALSSESDPATQAELLRRLGHLETALEAAGGGERDHEAKAILSGLGFKAVGTFSGPWASSAAAGSCGQALPGILFKRPDLLLLDEPNQSP